MASLAVEPTAQIPITFLDGTLAQNTGVLASMPPYHTKSQISYADALRFDPCVVDEEQLYKLPENSQLTAE